MAALRDHIIITAARNMTGYPGPDVYVLDIDGTLMHTHEIDNRCYWEAVHEVFGRQDSAEILASFTHVSDSGILQEWCLRYLGREPTAGETEQVKHLFMGLMESTAAGRPELFAPRAGLVPWLEQVTGQAGIPLAIATGSWGNTAAFKLEFSGLARFGLALASADDAIRRTDIMSIALSRLNLDPPPASHRVTYIGDGPWDYEASRELGWSFIGIAEGDRARALRRLGADRVEADFRGLARFRDSLAR
jgi:phosphoglycolate phosphatase-like HAD superfamily hydrolase